MDERDDLCVGFGVGRVYFGRVLLIVMVAKWVRRVDWMRAGEELGPLSGGRGVD